jgi:hypothetical protein
MFEPRTSHNGGLQSRLPRYRAEQLDAQARSISSRTESANPVPGSGQSVVASSCTQGLIFLIG